MFGINVWIWWHYNSERGEGLSDRGNEKNGSKYGTTKDSGGASAWISLTMGSNLGEGGEGEGRKGVAYSKKWQVSLCVTLHGAETLNIHSYLCVLL